MLNVHFLEKGLVIVPLPHFVHDFSRKMFLMLYSINLTKLHCLITLTFWDIGKYVYCSYLLIRLCRHRF